MDETQIKYHEHEVANVVEVITNMSNPFEVEDSMVKVTPHDGNPFHQNAHRALNFQVFPFKFCMHNDKSLL